MIINLAVNELKAAINCAGKKGIRYYLNGVCIDFIEPQKVAIIAIDGHCMFVCNADCDDSYTDFVGRVVIPGDAVTAALKSYDKKAPYIALKHIEGISYQLGNVVFNMIEGKFPDYRRVIPAPFEPSIANFDQDVVNKSVKAMMDYEGYKTSHKIAIVQNGDNAAVIKSLNDQALCVLMPLRAHGGLTRYSGFIVPVKQEVKQEVAA